MMKKAGYTATKVACGWARAVMKKVYPSIWAGAVTQKPPVTPKKHGCTDRRNRRTDRPTDEPTQRVID